MFRNSRLSQSKRSHKYNGDDTEEEEETEFTEVKVVNNDIYFYCDVTAETCLELIMAIREISKKSKIMAINFGIEPPPVNIYINSDGGEVHSALSVFDTIMGNDVEVNTIISGNAQSAATIISLAGHKRKITKNSYMLIHNISSGFWGKMHEFEDEMKNMAKLTLNLKRIYKENTAINKTQLENLLKNDLLLDAKTCIKYGLVDELV